jgi:two-component sensor histidine kinase/PAS domain-containing protein
LIGRVRLPHLVTGAWTHGIRTLPRLSARFHLLLLIIAVVVPVWLFAAYLLVQFAFNERTRFEREAQQVARQVALVVEGELDSLLNVLKGLSKSTALTEGDLAALHAEARRLVAGTDRVIILRDLGRTQLLNSQLPYGSELPAAAPFTETELAKLTGGTASVSNVYASPVNGEFNVALALPVRGPKGEAWALRLTLPTAHIRDVMIPAVPEGWISAVGDGDGSYVARSQMHEQTTGKPGLPEYTEKVVGPFGTFTAGNFQGVTLLAGYYRSTFSDWFYTANVPISVVEAPLWRSLIAIGMIGLIAMVVSTALAFAMGNGFARAARDLAQRAQALGEGRAVPPMSTSVTEFAAVADSLVAAERAIKERRFELETVLETVPAAVWFTYDPAARQVIRNRFAAELMELPTDRRTPFGTPDLVIDTIALKDGQAVSRDDRPLSRAMRGEQTDNEEFAYILASGVERILLTSARPIHDAGNRIIGAVQVSLDITERKRGEEQRKLLVNELNHRVKNTLAVVQAIASQTLRSAEDVAAAERSLTGRLVSLAKAHDILTQESWSGADLKELLAATLAPNAGLNRFRLEGPAVRLPPSLALSLALAVHELTTNAIKYGALSVQAGSVSIIWTVEDRGAARHLWLEWSEHAGPAVAPVRRKGFGTRMLERILDSEPGGSARISFDRTGVVCVIEVEIVEGGGSGRLPPEPASRLVSATMQPTDHG